MTGKKCPVSSSEDQERWPVGYSNILFSTWPTSRLDVMSLLLSPLNFLRVLEDVHSAKKQTLSVQKKKTKKPQLMKFCQAWSPKTSLNCVGCQGTYSLFQQ